MSLYMNHRFRELLAEELPSDDDFDERLDGQREAERDGGEGVSGSAAVSLSPEEDDRG